MIHKISRLLMTLVALFAMTAGAWAQMVTWVDTDLSGTGANAVTKDGVTLTPSNNNAKRNDNYFYAEGTNTFTTTLGNFTKIEIVFQTNSDQLPISIEGWTYEEISKFQPDHQAYPYYWIYTGKLTWEGNAESVSIQGNVNDIQSITFTIEPPIEVTWDATTKTAAFTMPGYNVVLTPIYAKAAAFATTGTEPNVTTLAPTAAEGVVAGTADKLVVEGTVATGQGTVMYAVTTDATTAPALSDFSTTVPTASAYDDATTVYVWYYIQGADTPDGQTATAENTFNDSEICATPIEVTVLSNKFDITFAAANANTIDGQNGKGTVTVKTGDAAAVDKTSDIDENHQLKTIKMGSEVKMTTKPGYKFRKVEVKKKAAPEYADKLTVAEYSQGKWSCNDSSGEFIGQVITLDQAIALANYQAAQTGKNCAVFYKMGIYVSDTGDSTRQLYYATSDGLLTSIAVGDPASMGLSGYVTYYVAK